jgi:sodium-dependent dicarboxylate transporter 2/3/5
MSKWRLIALLLGIFWFGLPWLLPLSELPFEARTTMGIFLIAAWYWVTEAIPIYATSLMVILLQVFILSEESAILRYVGSSEGIEPQSYQGYLAILANPIIILFLGGFVLARAAVKYQLDRTLMRLFLKPFGGSPAGVLAGLILITSVVGSFVSNTATTAMVMTVVFPLVAQMEPGDRFRIGLALSIPFAANIGGLITPIASPPNAVVLAALENQGIHISFSSWVLLMLPLVAIMLVILWYLLLRLYPTKVHFNVQFESDGAPLEKKRYWVYPIFTLTVLLWMSESLHGIPSSLVALIPIVLLTAFGLIDRDDIRGLSWEILWLVAGGIALGVSLRETGLAEWMVLQAPLDGLGMLGLLAVIAITGGVISNFLSNTVTASLLIPVVISLVTGGMPNMEADTPLMMTVMGLVVVCASSLGMTLPISTPPNAIAISTGLVNPISMMRVGLIVGLIEGALLLLMARFYWPWILS